jgi:predicted anti-sigma-YlaC factor YlaD
MKCKQAQARWHRRLDRGGSDEELDGHLGECAKCRAYAASLERVVGALDALHDDTESLVPSAIMPRPRATSGRRSEWVTPHGRTFLRVAATVVVAVAAGLWYRAAQVPTSPTGPSVMVPAFTAGITLQDKSRQRFIAVVGPSDDPRVQTFWVYPSVSAAGNPDRL